MANNPIRMTLQDSLVLSTSSSSSPNNGLFSTIIAWLSAIPNLIFSLRHKVNEFAFPLSSIEDLIFSLLHKLNQAFSPETHFSLAVAATLLLLYFCFNSLFLWLTVTCGIILKYLVLGLLITCRWVIMGLLIMCCWVVIVLLVTCRWLLIGLRVTCNRVFCCAMTPVRMMRPQGLEV